MEFRNPFTNATITGHNVDPNAYHANNAERGDASYVMSRSELTEFFHCPSRWRRGYRRPDSDAFDWGHLIDCLVLEADTFEERYAIAPATYPCKPTAKDPRTEKPWTVKATFCTDWQEEQESNGKEVIKYEQYLKAKAAVKWLLEDPEITVFLRNCQRSVMATADFKDAATGLIIPVKVLIDVVPDLHGAYGRSLGDLKTCESADPQAWDKAVYNYNYHVQAALYLDVYTAATEEDRVEFRHVLQESYHPYECGRELLSSDFLEMGRRKYLDALSAYAKCLATNKWPTYSNAAREINGWKVATPKLWMIEQAA